MYSSLQIHLLSFKALALLVFEIFCWQGKNAQNFKGPELSFFKMYSKVNQVVYSSLPVYSLSFKALALIVFFFRYFADKIASISFQRAITQERGIILSRKKICVSYFFMRNPYKKFQNSSMQGSKVMLCIKKSDERTDGRTEGRTNIQKQYAPTSLIYWSTSCYIMGILFTYA